MSMIAALLLSAMTDPVITAEQARAMESDALAAHLLGPDHAPMAGHRLSFAPDGRVSTVTLVEKGARDESGHCLRRTHTANLTGSEQPEGSARLHHVWVRHAIRADDVCTAMSDWIDVGDGQNVENGRRLLADLGAIAGRPTGNPLAALYCRDDTQQKRCAGDPHAAFQRIDLSHAMQFTPASEASGPFHQLAIEDRSVRDAGPAPVWSLRFLPQRDPAASVLLMRYYRPVPGPPLPPGHIPAVEVGEL